MYRSSFPRTSSSHLRRRSRADCTKNAVLSCICFIPQLAVQHEGCIGRSQPRTSEAYAHDDGAADYDEVSSLSRRKVYAVNSTALLGQRPRVHLVMQERVMAHEGQSFAFKEI